MESTTDYMSHDSKDAFNAQLSALLAQDTTTGLGKGWYSLPSDMRKEIIWSLFQEYYSSSSKHPKHHLKISAIRLCMLQKMVYKLSQLPEFITCDDLIFLIRKLEKQIRKDHARLYAYGAPDLESGLQRLAKAIKRPSTQKQRDRAENMGPNLRPHDWGIHYEDVPARIAQSSKSLVMWAQAVGMWIEEVEGPEKRGKERSVKSGALMKLRHRLSKRHWFA